MCRLREVQSLTHQFSPESSKFNPRKQNYMNQSYFFFILLYSKQCYQDPETQFIPPSPPLAPSLEPPLNPSVTASHNPFRGNWLMANKWKPSLTPRCSLQEPRVPESFCKVPNFASSFIFNSWYRYNRQFSRAFLDLCSAPPYICRNISLGILWGGNKSTIEELKSTCDQVKWLQ